jgi:murein DD-endopeptidase MepM/ murein hydrolase activator NlpD
VSRPLLAALALLAAPGDPPPVTYEPPVDARVSDPFRRPATPYGAGNRGLEYDTRAGAVVVAAAPGEVTFAGSVAGRRYVTVAHADGIRTTYGPLGRIAPGVVVGTAVDAGDAVGTAGELLLWTARIGEVYVDPAILLAASGPPRVRLVADRRLGPR